METAERLAIDPIHRPVSGSLSPPGSKSITNRALICAALADGRSTLRGALASDDTHVMLDSLRRLGFSVSHDPLAETIQVHGRGGKLPVADAQLFVGNSGTTIRFLVPMLATGHGRFHLDGVERMRARPIGDLLDAVRQLGGSVTCPLRPGYPPVVVDARGLTGGLATVRGDISSQFLSGLLLACPYAASDVELRVEGELVSQPYVTLTLGVMQAFGISVAPSDLRCFRIPAGTRYRGCEYAVEPDASAASYFWGAAAITAGKVTVPGLSRASLQGDTAFCECLRQMGCTVDYGADSITVTGGRLHGIQVNMNAISDTVQTLAAVALFADGPTTITGVAHIRHKESDRIGDLARELRKLGARVEERQDGLTITPGPLQSAELETYDDHRMAMSLALVGLMRPGVVIKNPNCIRKTYPGYFTDLNRLVGNG